MALNAQRLSDVYRADLEIHFTKVFAQSYGVPVDEKRIGELKNSLNQLITKGGKDR